MSKTRRSNDETAWWLTLGVGIVVLAVVAALLEWLRRTVNDVDEAVQTLWAAGKRLAQNTQTTHLLQGTKARAGDLLEELERHRAPAEGSETR